MTLLFDTPYFFLRALKKFLRNPILIFFSLFQPIIFLLLFTQLFSKFAAVPGLFPAGVSYLAYATPGILMQNAFTSALQSGTSVVEDINSGYLQKILVTPVSRPAILLGRLASDAFRVIIQSSIILALAYALGFSVATGLPGVLLILFIIAFFGLAWSGISLTLGLKTKSAETVFGIAGFLTFPLLFMSTSLVPATAMPSWIQNVSSVNPISFAVDAVRSLALLGEFVLGTILTAVLVIAAIAVVTLGATLYLFRKVVN